MAPHALCTRCLRQALRLNYHQSSTSAFTKRAFTPLAPAIIPIQSRRLHRSLTRQIPSPETQQPCSNESLPYSDVAGRRASEDFVAERTSLSGRQEKRVLLGPNNLFHSFTHSPCPEIRRRAQFMRQNAYCPHPDHQPTRAPTSPHDAEALKTGRVPPAHVRHECPDCGIPVYCSDEHFADDYAAHLEICDVLRQINEDDHDLHSGRFFPEFEYPGAQMEQAQINMTNWDTFLYSREFEAINDERSMRQVTRLLTYPVTIASFLHDLSPYSLRNGLTKEGLRSLSGMHIQRNIFLAEH